MLVVEVRAFIYLFAYFVNLQILCKYIIAYGFVFLWDCCVCVFVYICLSCFFCGSFSSICLLVLPYFDVLLLFCLILFFYHSLDVYYFIIRDRKMWIPMGKEVVERISKELGEENHNQNCMKKLTFFFLLQIFKNLFFLIYYILTSVSLPSFLPSSAYPLFARSPPPLFS